MNGQNVDIKELQRINFILLKEIDRVCKENHIRYFIDSGTLIGAVREKDFIPWDDDVDVVFLRKDFEKLRKLDKSAWGEDFRFLNYDMFGDDIFFDTLAHLFYTKEEVHMPNNVLKKVEGHCDPVLMNKVCLDIFVLDGTPDIKLLHYLKVVKCYLYHGLMMGHRPYIDYSEYPFVLKAFFFVFSNIGRRISLKKLFRGFDRLCKKNARSKSLFYSNIVLIKARKKHLKKEWWTDGAMTVEFHGEKFPAPKRYDDILTFEYGDYMHPPEKDKQVPEHFLAE